MNNSSDAEYSTVILGGGSSRRMGKDKRTLIWDGRPMLLHILDGFADCDDRMLSLREPDVTDQNLLRSMGLPEEVRMVYDRFPGRGPLAGVLAGLESMTHELLFVTCCDMPLADSRVAEMLCRRIGSHDAAVPVTSDGRLYPLSGLYRRQTAQTAFEMLKQDQRRMTDFLKKLDVILCPAQDFPVGEDTMINLNTPEELEAFTKQEITDQI